MAREFASCAKMHARGAWDIACAFGVRIFAAMGGITNTLAVKLVTENRVSYDFPLSPQRIEDIRGAQALAAATRAPESDRYRSSCWSDSG